MKNQLRTALLAVFTLAALSACSPTASQISSLLEKHPEILTNAIEKNPEKFMESVQKAAQAAQGKERENAAKEAEARFEAEFKAPLKPELDDKRVMGNKNAPITIVEYTDFQCPFCERGYHTLEEVRKTYGDKVRVIVKHLPLPNHPLAMPAAVRYEALMLQSPEKAFAFYHEVFSNQSKMRSEEYLDSVVKKIGADAGKVKKDMNGDAVKAAVKADMEEAQKFSFSGTPGFLVNGVSVRGAYPFDMFKSIIDRHLGTGEKK